jgi:hypothetical protein
MTRVKGLAIPIEELEKLFKENYEVPKDLQIFKAWTVDSQHVIAFDGFSASFDDVPPGNVYEINFMKKLKRRKRL